MVIDLRHILILIFIQDHWRDHDIAPTIDRIMGHFGVSRGVVLTALTALERADWIMRGRRSMILVRREWTGPRPPTVMELVRVSGVGLLPAREVADMTGMCAESLPAPCARIEGRAYYERSVVESLRESRARQWDMMRTAAIEREAAGQRRAKERSEEQRKNKESMRRRRIEDALRTLYGELGEEEALDILAREFMAIYSSLPSVAQRAARERLTGDVRVLPKGED
jgi:hypothetical protein